MKPLPAVVLVRNDVTTDARVRREVDALREAGYAPRVVGVRTDAAPRAEDTVAGAPLRRVEGRAPRVRLHRAASAGSARPSAAATARSVTPVLATASVGPVRRLGRLVGALRFYGHALAAVRRTRPALLHCNDHNTMWVGVAARALWSTPVVYDAHELWADRTGRWERRPVLIAAEWLFVRTAGAVITASPGYARTMAARYRISPPAVVLNVPAEAPDAADPVTVSDPPTLAYAGALVPGRGLEDAIRALVLLPGWRLLAVGPGPEAARRSLRALAAELGVADRLELRPAVAPERVVGVLRGAVAGLCLIQPVSRSYQLTMPNKLFEYLAAGLPVIATDLPVLGAAVAELGVGAVVTPGDLRGVADAALHLQAATTRDALAPRMRAARERYTWERERPRLEAAYARARARRLGGPR